MTRLAGAETGTVSLLADTLLPRNPPLSVAGLSGASLKAGVGRVFRRIEEVPGVVEEALEVGCAAVWLQLGLISAEAEELCREAGVPFVQDRCVKMEHCRWFGGLNWVGLSTGVISSRREETQRAS